MCVIRQHKWNRIWLFDLSANERWHLEWKQRVEAAQVPRSTGLHSFRGCHVHMVFVLSAHREFLRGLIVLINPYWCRLARMICTAMWKLNSIDSVVSLHQQRGMKVVLRRTSATFGRSDDVSNLIRREISPCSRHTLQSDVIKQVETEFSNDRNNTLHTVRVCLLRTVWKKRLIRSFESKKAKCAPINVRGRFCFDHEQFSFLP